MRRLNVQVTVLLLTGAGLLHIALFTDLYLRYVKAGLRVPLVASGVALVLLGGLAAARDGYPFLREAPGRAHAGHGHDHDHARAPRAGWLLLVPAVLLLLFAPPALGSYTASREISASASDAGRFPALPGRTGAVVALPVSEFSSRAVWDTGRSLKGRTVRLTGFVTPADDGTWYLSRLLVTCCAADAQVLKVAIHGTKAPPPADAWVTVTGTWHPLGKLGTDSAQPGLDITTMTRVPAPRDPYKDLPRTY